MCVIPARYGSTRLPGKPLLDIAGKPLIRRVYERALEAQIPDRVVVATDDEKIAAAVEGFGGEAVMTLATHPTGTDRIAEVAARYEQYDVIVNVQGDEPLIDPRLIDRLAAQMQSRDDIAMATVAAPLTKADYDNRNAVKVVCNLAGDAMYFSRSLIPYPRQAFAALPQKHVGIYAYRRDFLLTFAALSPTPAERTESLEQLRALEHGYRIGVIHTDRELIGVDTLEELLRVRALFEGGHHETGTNR